MVKKVTAPKTYDPGRGRPLEHLAYLNRREMDYLRSINGNNMERGPRGLPSFPPDDSLGSSSSTSRAGQGGGGKTGGSSGSSGGATGGGSKGAPSSGRAPAAKAPTAPSPKAPTAPTSPMSGQKTSFSSPRAASSYNKDVALKTGLEKNNAISAVKNTPAVKNDGVTGFKAQSLGVKPIGKTTIGASRPASSIGPANRDMEVNRNLDRIARDFYNSDPDYQKGLAQQRATVAKSRESVGLFGKGVSPRDTISSPARTAPSTGMTQSEKQALLDKYNPVKAAGRLSDAVSSAASKIYNDPVGTASSGLNSLSEYMRDSYNTIAAGSLSSDPDLRSAAAEKAAEIALNYGIGGLGTSFATKAIPENSLGSLVVGRSTADKAIQKQFSTYDNAIQRGASPEDAFYESLKNAPSYSGGVVDIVADIPKSPNEAIRFAQGVEIEEPFNLRSSGLVDDAMGSVFGKKPLSGVSRYDQVFERGPINESYPEVGNMPVYKDPDHPTFNRLQGGTIGFYSPAGGMQPGLWKSATPGERYNALKYGSTAIQAPMKQNIVSRALGAGDVFRRNAAHEGVHRVADVDARRGVSTPIPQGTSDFTQERIIRDAISQSSLPPMSSEEIRDLAWSRYKYNPGEVIARQAEDFLDRPVRDMRDYRTRFGNMSLDDLRNIMRYGISEP